MKAGIVGLNGVEAVYAKKALVKLGALAVLDPEASLVAAFKKDGAEPANTLPELIRSNDVVMLCLDDLAARGYANLVAEKLPDELDASKIVIDLTCNNSSSANNLLVLEASGASLLTAVVLPLQIDAGIEETTVIVSGDEAAYLKCRSLFEAFGTNVVYCARQLHGARTLSALNKAMTIASAVSSLEAVAAGKRMGLTTQSMIEVLNKGSGRNFTTRFALPSLGASGSILEVKTPDVLAGLNDTIGLSFMSGVPSTILSVVRSFVQAAHNANGPSTIYETVVSLVESISNVRLSDDSNRVDEATTPGQPTVNESPTIGYVGVGAMGAALARRLLTTQRVQVFDIRPTAVRPFEADGVAVAPDLRSLARACDVIMLCVPTTTAVNEVLFGPGGLQSGLSAGKIVVDQTTGDPSEVRRISDKLAAMSVSFLDAPVTGGPESAQAGTCTIICGGEIGPYQRCLPILRSITDNIVFCGPVGSGHAAKLVNNASNICNRVICYEAASLGIKAGLSLEAMHNVVNKSTGWSFASQRVFRALAKTERTATITLELSRKDIESAVKMGIGCGAPMLVADVVRNIFELGIAQLGPQKNIDDLAQLFEQLAGIRFAGS
jgi:3-hydroxyisobutyrate dehydrogenase